MKDKQVKFWFINFLISFISLVFILSIRLYLRINLIPYLLHFLIPIIVLGLMVYCIISSVILLIKFKIKTFFKPLILIGLIIFGGFFIYRLSTYIGIRTIYSYCNNCNNLQLKNIIDYAKAHNIKTAFLLNNSNSFNLYSNNQNDKQGLQNKFNDNKFDKMLSNLNIIEINSNDDITFFTFYKHSFFCYGLGIAYSNKKIDEVPFSYNCCPIYDWQIIEKDWYFYTYAD